MSQIKPGCVLSLYVFQHLENGSFDSKPKTQVRGDGLTPSALGLGFISSGNLPPSFYLTLKLRNFPLPCCHHSGTKLLIYVSTSFSANSLGAQTIFCLNLPSYHQPLPAPAPSRPGPRFSAQCLAVGNQNLSRMNYRMSIISVFVFRGGYSLVIYNLQSNDSDASLVLVYHLQIFLLGVVVVVCITKSLLWALSLTFSEYGSLKTGRSLVVEEEVPTLTSVCARLATATSHASWSPLTCLFICPCLICSQIRPETRVLACPGLNFGVSGC